MMKNYALILIASASLYSFSCLAQRGARVPANSKTGSTQFMSENNDDNDVAIVTYHVEERVNMAFASNITTYDVSNVSLVATNDLGPNNVRVVTPRYKKAKMPIALTPSPVAPVEVVITAPETIKPVVETPKKKLDYVDIDILDTYERVLEKGYKSVDMLKRVANNRFFKGDLTVAAKWYTELFSLTDDFQVEFYYRYAQSLKAIGQIKKSEEMMEIFNKKNK